MQTLVPQNLEITSCHYKFKGKHRYRLQVIIASHLGPEFSYKWWVRQFKNTVDSPTNRISQVLCQASWKKHKLSKHFYFKS